MIGRIRGVLLETSPPHLLLEVGSVGYEIEAPLSTFESAAGEGTHRGEGSFATY